MKRAITFVLLFIIVFTGVGADPAFGSDLPPIACSPESPVVRPGETVTLRVWAISEGGEALTYEWEVKAGSVRGTGSEVAWSFEGVKPGTYDATAYVAHPSGETGKCSMRILVEPPERRGGITGWSLLLTGDKEATGYGLYSYILFGARPTPTTRERYLKALAAYVLLQESIASLEASGIPRHQLNITYVPVTKKLPGKDRPTAEWLLENYDFARARAILSHLPGPYRTEGPYLVSYLTPLSTKDRIEGKYLYQDLSTRVPKVIIGYAREFLSQAAQERYWEERTAKKMALNLQNTLFLLSLASTDVMDAMKELKEIRDAVRWVE